MKNQKPTNKSAQSKQPRRSKGSLFFELVEFAKKDQRTGIKILDNAIIDALRYKRLATDAEIKEIKRMAKNKDINEVLEFIMFKQAA